MNMPQMPKWYSDDGEIISCTEKVKVMQENMQELYQLAQDTFEDALLMGCSEKQIRDFFVDLVRNVHNPYRPAHRSGSDSDENTPAGRKPTLS